MLSIKQLQRRLMDKKYSLKKVNSNIAYASNGESKMILSKLKQEKQALSRDISNLEKQLVIIENASRN
ncbi:MAG: hypothetical protein JXL81_07145 [Deltaproteobacteria bacterium]|nr:hypothetical protein [Deltaproteobacteria bacterium]